MIKHIHIVLVIWIFTIAVPIGFAESFQYRPTAEEMDELVTLGIESGHGVYERCYATQYSPSPAYYVSPPTFIGTNGWYLSTSVMQSLDDKAKALIPYYASTNTVYDGTTNIVMLSVTGLWAQLKIGDHTNQFTGTPAIGTNPPTYGDYPWRIYEQGLVERYKVLEAMEVCSYVITNIIIETNITWYTNIVVSNPHWSGLKKGSGGGEFYGSWTWEEVQSSTEESFSWYPPFATTEHPQSWRQAINYVPPQSGGGGEDWTFTVYGGLVQSKLMIGPFATNIAHSCIATARSVKTDGYGGINEFGSQGAIGAENVWVTIIDVTNSYNEWEESATYGSISFPEWCQNPSTNPNVWATKGNRTDTGYLIWTGDVPCVVTTNVFTNWSTNWIPPSANNRFYTNDFQYNK